MKDGIILGTGNSRYLKGAGWPSTYAEFKSMAEAGTLPFDLNGINEAGWQQIGTALNKGNLLDDIVANRKDGVITVNDFLGSCSLIESGTYTGTGTSGSSNPNSLTFGFIPKVVFISAVGTTPAAGALIVSPYVWGAQYMYVHNASFTYVINVTISGKTMTWYRDAPNNAHTQLNYSGGIYRWSING